jgi:uroporphyrinogen-III decarboxylase
LSALDFDVFASLSVRGYLLSAGGGMNENTSEEKINALIEVAKFYGRYS